MDRASPFRLAARPPGRARLYARDAGVIDLHMHILPGVDDGARTMHDAIAMAEAAVADGVRVVAATPHVRGDYPTSAERMASGLAELRAELRTAGVLIEVLPGAEIALDRLPLLSGEERERLGLGGNPRCLLLEFAYYGWPLALPAIVVDLRSQGVLPVLAHPERNGDVQAGPERLRPIVTAGALVQVTAAAIDGRLGRRSRDTALELVERGLAHLIASDGHTPDIRNVGMSSAAHAIGDEALARWLTEDVPAAIVAGAEIPARPPASVRTRGRRFGRLLGR
jgi:protein-tyrosine phosphatase